MSLAKLVALSLAVSKGSAIPRSLESEKGKHFYKEMNKQIANAQIRKAISVLKRLKKTSKNSKSVRSKISRSKSVRR